MHDALLLLVTEDADVDTLATTTTDIADRTNAAVHVLSAVLPIRATETGYLSDPPRRDPEDEPPVTAVVSRLNTDGVNVVNHDRRQGNLDDLAVAYVDEEPIDAIIVPVDCPDGSASGVCATLIRRTTIPIVAIPATTE
ncbi:hypothetical protein [Halarchaeum sp. P4]|uniref:hypothetical protein n=1 Tax=Halarchaeum sp. P4 TaxID=3421639 RepID=UPI003EBCCF97